MIGSQVSITCSQTQLFNCCVCILSIIVILSSQRGCLTWKSHDWWWCYGL